MSKENKTQEQGENQEENKNKEENKNNEENKNKKDNTKSKKMTSVEFLRSYTPYIKGEKAGLDPEEAKELIKKKVCQKI
ncbi:MAG: hypothetical protein PF572_02355 [Patescibacteria group bacterium]|jgi:hypothetical protein|nr:hypothetical protein [Patescibacteria group bacterium]